MGESWVTMASGNRSSWELRISYRYTETLGALNSSPVTAMAEVVGVQSGCSYTIKIPGNNRVYVTVPMYIRI